MNLQAAQSRMDDTCQRSNLYKLLKLKYHLLNGPSGFNISLAQEEASLKRLFGNENGPKDSLESGP